MVGLKKYGMGLLVCMFIMLAPVLSYAWPTEADWIPLVNATGYVSDPDSDYNQCQLDIVGDSTRPSAMVYNDGTYIYYRIRVDCDPSQGTYLTSNTWGLLIDTDQNADAYEWMVRIDGRSNSDEIVISQNTVQGTLGDPSDSAEIDVWTDPLDATPGSENFKVTIAGTDFPLASPDTDYWIEYRYPYDVWLFYMGLDDSSIIRYFVGTGVSGQTLSGDLVGTDLYTDLTNPILPSGVEPTTGYVKFVSDLAGNGDVTETYPGETIFIKVEDLDLDGLKTVAQTITVLVNTVAGDSETLTLTETGLNTGIFTGSILTTEAAAVTENGSLELTPIETVRVEYIDVVDATLNKNRLRYDSLTALPTADLVLTKTVDNSTPNEGDLVSFTLTLRNDGSSNVYGIQVSDVLPGGLIYNSDSGAGLYNHSNGIWTITSIPNGDSRVLIINAAVDTGTTGQTIVNNATVFYNPQYDPDSSNNSDSASITIQGANLAITKAVDKTTPGEGDTIVYAITLANNGSNDATTIIVNDILPSGITYSSHIASHGAYVPGSGVWDGFALLNGQVATLDITATVDVGTSGNIITNIANIASADQADPDVVNNVASASLAVDGVDLSVSKVANTATPDVGQSVVFTVTVTNISTNAASGIEITDVLPAGLTYVSSVPSAGSYNSGSGVWSGFSLASSVSETLEITATVDVGTGGSTLVNSAQLTTVTETDLDPGNNTASYSVTVKSADISLAKTVDNNSPDPSTQVVFTVTVQNNGPSTATGVEVTDSMTAGLTYVSSVPSAGSYNSGTGLWSGFSLAPGASETLAITATVPGTSGVVETNTATITASDQEDTVAANNSASVDITVGGVDLKMTKTVDNMAPSEGATINYTILVENIGKFPATGIEVIDSLPGGVTYVSDSASQGSYNQSQAKWSTLSILNGSSATLTITVTVDAGTNGQTIENVARISAVNQTDIDITNNLSKVSIYVGSTDLSITKSVDNSTPTEGDTVSFTVTVKNIGLNPATDVRITDLIPSGLTYLDDSAGGFYNTVNGVWNATTPVDTAILPGGSRSFIINATVDAGTYGQTIINYSEITATGQLDPNATNDLASTSVTVQGADISIFKSGDNSTPDEGAPVSFTISATNYGPHNATGVIVQDVLPAGLTYTADNSGGSYNPATGIWTVGPINKLSSASLIINATADTGTGGITLSNIANVVSADQTDPTGINNSSTFEVTPVKIPFPIISVTKSVLTFWDPYNLSGGTQKAIPGAVMLYSVNVINQGDGSPDVDSMIIKEIIPANTEMYVDNMGGAVPGPVDFVDGAVASGLTYTFGGLGDGTDSVEFSSDGGATYTYTPVSTAGYDANVTNFRITFTGTFNASDGTNHPTFDIKFRVRVK